MNIRTGCIPSADLAPLDTQSSEVPLLVFYHIGRRSSIEFGIKNYSVREVVVKPHYNCKFFVNYRLFFARFSIKCT